MKIYEIDEELRRLFAGILNAVGDVDNVIIDRINELATAKEEKLLTLAKLIKEKEAEAHAMKEAEKDIATRRKRAEKWVSTAKEYIVENMDNKISDPFITVSKRASKALVVEDEEAFRKAHDEFCRWPEVKMIVEKNAVKNAMKHGQIFDGVRLEERFSLQIK